MADNIEIETGAGTPARVAFDMAKYLKNVTPTGNTNEAQIKNFLDLYAQCLVAARGLR